MAPSCTLDDAELRAQLARYRTVGRGAHVAEQTPRRLVVEVDEAIDEDLIAELVAVEHECRPFFTIDWTATPRRLAVSVSIAEHEPALHAIAHALDTQAPGSRESPPIAFT
jgi:hypothetical protein